MHLLLLKIYTSGRNFYSTNNSCDAAALSLLAALNFLGREKDMAESATQQAEGV